MKRKVLYSLYAVLLVFCRQIALNAQDIKKAVDITPGIAVTTKGANLVSFSNKAKLVLKDWAQYNKDYENHPDKGFLSPYAPPNSENLIEVFEKRTAISAYFVDASDPGKVISQGSLGNMHYQKNGKWLALDYRLDKVSKDVYEASHQPIQVGFNTSEKYAYFNEEDKKLKFNQWILTGEQNGQKTELAKADWSDYTVGDDGIRIHNIFPGIDAEMTIQYGKIKTNFIVKNNQYPNYDALLFADKFEYNKGDFKFEFTHHPVDNIGDMQLRHNGDVISEVSKAVMYAQSRPEDLRYLAYLPEDKTLSIRVSVAELNSLLQYGKVVIDPLVTGNPATLNQSGVYINSSHYTANCSGSAFDASCGYSWNVTVPAGIGITRKYFSAFARTHAPCVNGNVVFLFRCYSVPASGYLNYPFSADPSDPNSGTTGTVNLVTGTVDIPSPAYFPRSCSAQNLPIELSILRRCPAPAAPTNCGYNCVAGEGPFVVSVEGRTVEIGATTASSTNICAGQTVSLSTTASFGVPPVTAIWTPGGLGGSPVNVAPTTTTTYKAVVTDACNNKDSATVTVNVTPLPPVPAVTISANPGNAICTGTNVTFTATATNAGTSPVYQWKLNGANVGTNSATYTNSSLANGNVISCQITPNVVAACADNTVRTSNSITMTVTPPLTAALSISASNNNICQGTGVLFTANLSNGGTNPVYQWKLNGSNVGTNSSSYSNAALNNGDQVTCTVTVGAGCISPASLNSNTITMTVSPVAVPTLTIAANPGNTICAGTSVTFTATAANVTSPVYQWKLNGANVGTNSATYTNNGLANGNTITCEVTSSYSCASPNPRVSNTITMVVNPVATPDISIAANPGNTICAGTAVTFTATANNVQGPVYQWRLNGAPVGTNSATYTNAALTNGNTISCDVTSTYSCAVPANASSNVITMIVNPVANPAITISANPGNTICAGTAVTFTATASNMQSSVYQWKLNGAPVGTNSATYTNATLTNGNTISCDVTSAYSCAVPATVSSNVITMTVNPIANPAISISANPGNTICAGTAVTFTATASNVQSPVYQWKLNGAPVGTNSATYTNAALTNSNTISCDVTSAYSCAVPATVGSNTIAMVVNPVTYPAVSITVSPSDIICAGTPVTFSATVTDVNNPAYQWMLDGAPVGTNSATYSSAALSNGNVVHCIVTSDNSCASPNPATSNDITMTVRPVENPAISISANPGNTICAGTAVTFTATASNVQSPVYQWRLDGASVGTNSATYTNATLSNGNTISCDVTSAYSCAIPATVGSNIITMVVNPVTYPAVSITVSPSDTICAGTLVTFTATVTDVNNPAYQWMLDGAPVGTNSATYSNAALSNGNIINCIVTSDNSCANPNPATSNAITMTVRPVENPAISISANPGNTICAGTAVTFTATTANVQNPVYQWKLDGANVGTNSPVFTSAALVSGNAVSCEVTSGYVCAVPQTVSSNVITMIVNPVHVPAITIAANPGNTICAGTVVTFTATATNVSNPVYQWKVNGSNVGTNAATYTNAALVNGNIVTCEVTSDYICAVPQTVSSNAITMVVHPVSVPAITITAYPRDTICSGTPVTFMATAVNVTNPVYQWKLNGVNVGTNSDTYSVSSLGNGNTISCEVTSAYICAIPNPVLSNIITMTVNPTVTPVISITTSNSFRFCEGTSITFIATANNVSNPVYQWLVNGTTAGTNSTTYTSTTLNNGDVITCRVTSDYQCASPGTVTSNAIAVQVLPYVSPAIAVSIIPGDTVCEHGQVMLNATSNNVANPVYQWKVNNVNVGTNASYYIHNTPLDGEEIICVVTSDYLCAVPADATSNTVRLHVKPTVYPVVTLTALPGTTLCAGDTVHFTASISGGGNAPVIQWYRDNRLVRTNTLTYSEPGVPDNSNFHVTVISNEACALSGTVSSNTLNIRVNEPVRSTDSIKICRSQLPFSWNGHLVDSIGRNVSTYTTTSVVTGCDSIVTLNLFAEPLPVIKTLNVTSCKAVTFEGNVYDASTVLLDTARSAFGCDSFISQVNILIAPAYYETQTLNLFACGELVFENKYYNTSASFTDTLRSVYGCDSVSRTVNIEIETFTLNLTVSPEEPRTDQVITAVTSSNGPAYQVNYWYPEHWFVNQQSTEQSFTASENGTIIVAATSANGCTDTASLDLKVIPSDKIVFVPNAFTPNGDGLNDFFGPKLLVKKNFNSAIFAVYNRFGTRIFDGVADNKFRGWDGRYAGGTLAEVGTYYYYIEIKFEDGEVFTTKGDVTLLR